jgi:hypothetical protein
MNDKMGDRSLTAGRNKAVMRRVGGLPTATKEVASIISPAGSTFHAAPPTLARGTDSSPYYFDHIPILQQFPRLF